MDISHYTIFLLIFEAVVRQEGTKLNNNKVIHRALTPKKEHLSGDQERLSQYYMSHGMCGLSTLTQSGTIAG